MSKRLCLMVALWAACDNSSQKMQGSEDLAMPDLAMPDLAAPDLAMPDLSVSDLAMADLAMLDFAAPDFATPDFSLPDFAMNQDMTIPGVYVDPVNGNDTNDGSFSHPFKTVSKANNTISAGMGIYLFGGTYDNTNQSTLTMTLKDNVVLRALTPGTVTFDFASAQLSFNGGTVEDITFKHFVFGLNVTGGTFTATGVSFDSVDCPITTKNSSVASVVVGTVTNVPTSANCATFWADGGSTISWKGGSVSGTSSTGNAVFVRAHATANVDSLTVQHWNGHAVVGNDNAHITLKNCTLDDSGAGSSSGADKSAILMGGNNTETPMTTSLVLDTTSLTNSRGHGIAWTLYGTTAETPSISLTNSHVDGSAGEGLHFEGAPTNAGLTVTITSTNSTFNGNGGVGILSPRATVTLSGGSVSNNTSYGIELTDSGSVNSIKIRTTTIGNNGTDFIALNGSSSSVLDLGKNGDSGGIVFTSVPATHSALNLTAAIVGSAIGNTWIANQQGADGSGHYTTSTTIPQSTSGTNVTTGTGASVVLAP